MGRAAFVFVGFSPVGPASPPHAPMIHCPRSACFVQDCPRGAYYRLCISPPSNAQIAGKKRRKK